MTDHQEHQTVPQAIEQPTISELAASGYFLIPLGKNKKPLVKWKLYQEKAPTIDELKHWYESMHPNAWAALTGEKPGIFALDFDTEFAVEQMRGWGLEPHRRTGGGGYQVEFKYPGFRIKTVNSKASRNGYGKKYPGIDVKGDGGYCVVLGSNKNGPYKWLRPHPPYDINVLPLPVRKDLGLVPPGPKTAKPNSPARLPASRNGPVPSEILIASALDVAASDGRNNGGLWLACQFRDNHYKKAETRNLGLEYVRRAPDLDQHGRPEAYTESEWYASVDQAYSRPPREPWTSRSSKTSVQAQKAEERHDASSPEGLIEGPPNPQTLPDTVPSSAPDQEQSAQTPESSQGPTKEETRYKSDRGRIWAKKHTQAGEVWVPLSNFDAKVSRELVLDDGVDGVEPTRAFLLEGTLTSGKHLPAVRVSAARFGTMNWVHENWGLKAVTRAGSTVKDQLREAIQLLSPEAPTKRIFLHTGWTKIDRQWCYLTAAGGIGLQEQVDIDLGSPELARYRLPAVPVGPVNAMRTSLALLHNLPAKIAVPLFGATYRAPLASCCELDTSICAVGRSGSLKSTIISLFLSHFGDFDRRNLPGNWISTINQLEKRAFILKDIPFVVDDYVPCAENKDLETKAARLIRAQGNLQGRGRLRSDLTERPIYAPRGLIISTGEQYPTGQSVLARTLLVHFALEMFDIKKLNEVQENSHRLPHAMAGYINWLAPQIEGLADKLTETFRGTRNHAVNGSKTHLRIPEVLAHLWVGINSAFNYATEIGACESVQRENLEKLCWSTLLELGREQSGILAEEQPSRRFLSVLYTLLNQNRVMLCPTAESEDLQIKPDRLFIGWFDDDFLYLIPEAALQAVVGFAATRRILFLCVRTA